MAWAMIAFRNYLWALYLPLSLLLAGPVHAQSASPKPVRLPCGAGLVQQQYPAPKILNAAYSLAALRAGQLRIDFAGHSTFLITSPSGVKVATDYNDYYRAKSLPDIALMSSWHGNHSTGTIEAGITHALRGWNSLPGGPSHDVRLKDLRVYSMAENLGVDGGGYWYPTSIFVIQSHGICIAHLGLIGHVIEPPMLARIGRIDKLLTPIDQRVTQSFEEIIHNIKAINPKIVVPMHYNSEDTVEGFLHAAKAFFPVRRPQTGTLIAEKSRLPGKTEIYFLLPPFFSRGL
jgi:L-ascorbate metabolism protein UlaG (beta-lactamase superfamily)